MIRDYRTVEIYYTPYSSSQNELLYLADDRQDLYVYRRLRDCLKLIYNNYKYTTNTIIEIKRYY